MALSAVIGGVVFERCLGLAILDPRFVSWIYLWGADASVTFTGWHMFRSEPWTIPPGAIHSFGHPVGTSVALTDSFPVMALAFKLVEPLLPEDFQYLGMWRLSCFVLQAVFGALLVGTATNRLALRLLGAAFFALSPTLLHRLPHFTLSGHWLLVAALWLHASGRTVGRNWRTLACWAALTAFAAGTTPYLAAMVLALAAASTIDSGSDAARFVRRGLPAWVALVAVTLAMWWAAGYFVVQDSRDLQSSGFGNLSMNLLSPLIPPPGSLLSGRVPFATARPDQNEGYLYFGLGGFFLLIAWLAALAVVRAPSLRWSAPNVLLVAVCAVLTAFALSQVVTAGTMTVLQYDPRWWGPFTTFRASGRMAWPVYYAVTFGLIAAIVRRLSPAAAVAVMAAAVALQWADMRGPLHLVRRGQEATLAEPLPSGFWDVATRHYKHLVLHQTNMCPAVGAPIDYRFLALRAGRAGATINAGFAARYDAEAVIAYCRGFAADLAQGRVEDDSLYVLQPPLAPGFQAARPSVACADVDGFAACFTAASYATWRDRYDIIRRALPPAEEIHRFRARLEADYRDRMRRPANQYAGTIDDRTEAIVRFLAFRAAGCERAEAATLTMPAGAGEHAALCARTVVDRRPLPPADEVLAMRDQLEGWLASRGAARTPTHVDASGEAIWTRDYLDLRRSGRAEGEAADQVLARIRAIAP